MGLSKKEKGKLTNAGVEWVRANDADMADIMTMTPIEKRDALGPFVQADRDATIAIQGKLATTRAEEDADLQQSVDDCNKVLQELDSAIMKKGG